MCSVFPFKCTLFSTLNALLCLKSKTSVKSSLCPYVLNLYEEHTKVDEHAI